MITQERMSGHPPVHAARKINVGTLAGDANQELYHKVYGKHKVEHVHGSLQRLWHQVPARI